MHAVIPVPQVFAYTKQNILIKSVTYVTEMILNKTQRGAHIV